MVKISLVPKAASKPGVDKLEMDAKVFVFDKDGTLISHDHFIPIMEKRVELLAERVQLSESDQNELTALLGLDPKTHEIIPHGTMFIARADTQLLTETFMMEKGLRHSEAKEHVAKVFEHADEQVALEKYIKPFPGVPELLAELNSHGAKIAIATHDSTAAAQRQLTVAGLEQYLDLIIGLDYDESITHKPSPSMMLAACKVFEREPKEAAVMGDSKNDVLMGIRGGAGLAIAVLSGEHSANEFTEYDAIIDSVTEIKIVG